MSVLKIKDSLGNWQEISAAEKLIDLSNVDGVANASILNELLISGGMIWTADTVCAKPVSIN